MICSDAEATRPSRKGAALLLSSIVGAALLEHRGPPKGRAHRHERLRAEKAPELLRTEVSEPPPTVFGVLQVETCEGSELGVGWKVQGLIVQGSVDPTDLPGQPYETGESADIDTVHHGPHDYGVATVDGWTFIADPEFRVSFDEQAVLQVSGTRRALAWVTNSVSTTHGFAWYLEGEMVRQIIYTEGELADEHGAPLPEEQGAPEPLSEDYVFEMMLRLTGVGWGAGAGADYSVWVCTS